MEYKKYGEAISILMKENGVTREDLMFNFFYCNFSLINKEIQTYQKLLKKL